jgi:hypothetical protein
VFDVETQPDGGSMLIRHRQATLASPGEKIYSRTNISRLYGPSSCYPFRLLTCQLAGGFAIANKTISRKHLVVEVDEVKPGDSVSLWTLHLPDNISNLPKARLHTRSRITLEDLNTKIGTLVNGDQIRGQRRVLEDKDNDIRLGQYEKLFRSRLALALLIST